MKNTILIVDDADINRDLLRNIFEEQFPILEAADGEEAIEVLKDKSAEIAVIFLDLVMPKKGGLEVLEFMRQAELINRIPVIMITGQATNETDVKAYECGAADIIYKPFDAMVVMRRTTNLMEQYEIRNEMESKLEVRTRELRESQQKLAKNFEFLSNALGSIIEYRMPDSGKHVKRVRAFAKIILGYLQNNYPEYAINESRAEMILAAIGFHDIGKFAIPDKVLTKKERLSTEEETLLKRHTIYGCEILEQIKQEDSEFYKYCYDICRWHHERYDGNGYPDKLVGENTPIAAQVVGLCDCFDKLVKDGMYKEDSPVKKAIDMIKAGKYGVFSDKLLDCLEMARFDLSSAVSRGVEFL